MQVKFYIQEEKEQHGPNFFIQEIYIVVCSHKENMDIPFDGYRVVQKSHQGSMRRRTTIIKCMTCSFGNLLWELVHNHLPLESISNLKTSHIDAFKNMRPNIDDLPENLAFITTLCQKEAPEPTPPK